MTCAIEEFPLLPFEPVPRGETLAHWRNEIAEWAEGLQPLICRETPEVDLTDINLAIAEAQQALEDFENRLVPYPYTALGIVYATTTTTLGQLAIGSANQVLGINAAGTAYEYKTVAGTANQIGVTHGVGTITLTLLAHAASHMSAGSDPIRIDELKIGTDVTTLNATTTEHGLLRKLSGNAAQFLAGDGTWATPSGLTPGTVNYLPKWTAGAPYLSATSLVYDNGTNVGINVGASPLATLHVASNTAAGVTGTNIQLRLTDTANTARSLLLGWDQSVAAGYIQATVVGTSADTIQLNPAGGLVTVGSGGLRLEASATFGWHTDVKFVRNAAGVVHMRDGANPQVLYVFNSYSSGSVYEGLYMGWSSNVAYLYTETPGGASPRELRVGTYGAIGVSFMTNNTVRWQVNGTGHLVLGLDVTYNIGAAAQRINDVYIGGNLYFSGVAAGYLKGNGTSAVSSVAAIPVGDLSGTVAISQGGTGQTTALAAFNALSPLTTRGDLLTRDASNNVRLAIGTVGKYLHTDGTDPGWKQIAFTELSGTLAIGQGGTGQTTALSAFNALSPLTTRGDLLTRDASNNVRLAIGTVGKYLRTDGTDPSWSALLASDLSGQVAVANGGTGAATLTGILQGNGTSAVDAITGTADNIPKWASSAPYLGASLLHSTTNLVEQYNSTNAQSWSLFGTRTSATVYERMTVKHNASASGITFTSEAAGGGTLRDFIFTGANLGIGGAPLAKFHVIKGSAAGTPAINAQTTAVFQNTATTSSDAFYSLIAGNAGTSVVMFGDNDAEFRGRVSYTHSSDDLAFWTAGAEAVRITSGRNICLGVTAAGTSATQTVVIESGLAPSGDVTNAFQMYSQDVVAGNAVPHFRTENGSLMLLYRDTGWTLPTGTALKGGWATATVTPTQLAQTVKAILDHLQTNMGLFGA